MQHKNTKADSQDKQIIKAVVLLAGYGTRCLPFTKVLPKALIPILNKPAIHYIVEEIEKTPIKEVVFILPKDCNGKIVKQYFSSNKTYERFLKQRKKDKDLQHLTNIKTNLKIRCIFTKKANGGGGALLNAEKYVKNQTFVLLNGDDLFFGGGNIINDLIANYNKFKKNIVALKEVEEGKKGAYGIYAGNKKNEHFELTKMIEKPFPNQIDSNLAGVGRYLVEKDIFKILKSVPKENGEIHVTYAFMEYIKQNRLNGIIAKQTRIDGGNTFELAKGAVLLALENKDYKEKMGEFLNSLR